MPALPPTTASRICISSPVRGTWTETIKDSGEPEDMKLGACSQQNGLGCGGDFKWPTVVEADCNSDVPSPRLWKNMGSPLRPSDRTRAIAQYRQEMLDMIRDVPQSDFDLSMQDLVELFPKEERDVSDNKDGRVKEQAMSTRAVSRVKSMDHGVFLLNLLFPLPGGWKRSSVTRRTDGRKGGVDKSGRSERWSQDSSSSSSSKRRILVCCPCLFLGRGTPK